MYVLDGSGSVNEDPFNSAKTAIADSLDDFTIGTSGTRVGFIVYGGSATTHLTLVASATQGNEGSKNTINGVSFPSAGSTRTGIAISAAISHFASNGHVNRVNATIVITDGQSGDSVTGPATNAANAGITMYAIGVGGSIDNAELLQIANNENSRVLTIANMSELGTTLRALDASICTGEIFKDVGISPN